MSDITPPDRPFVERVAASICTDEISAMAYARGVVTGLRAAGVHEDMLKEAVRTVIEYDGLMAVGVAFLDLADCEVRGNKSVN